MTDRTQSISVNDVQSERSAIYYSDQQGSFLGSTEFSSYTDEVVVVFHLNLVHRQLHYIDARDRLASIAMATAKRW